jgi:predicted DNA-binding transcriptional regulator YafY
MPRPAARVLMLLELLQSGGLRTLAELADRLEVDERTVRRYVGHLIDLGIPVESVRGRYGGYRLSPGYRMPPLMLGDDEALAVLLGLLAARRAGLLTAAGTAAETALAKIRRVLPDRLARRLDTVLGALTFTAPPVPAPAPSGAILLTVADAVHHHRPVAIRYTGRDGRTGGRTVHPYGLVVHAGRWYVTAVEPAIGEERTFRLDRIADARALPGTFDPPAGADPAERVLRGLAEAPHRHAVTLWIQAPVEHIRSHLPASLATVAEPPQPGTGPGEQPQPGTGPGEQPQPGTGPGEQPWRRVDLRVERLDWLPGVLAALDRPFVVERPAELRDRIGALADRLRAAAAATGFGDPARPDPPDR